MRAFLGMSMILTNSGRQTRACTCRPQKRSMICPACGPHPHRDAHPLGTTKPGGPWIPSAVKCRLSRPSAERGRRGVAPRSPARPSPLCLLDRWRRLCHGLRHPTAAMAPRCIREASPVLLGSAPRGRHAPLPPPRRRRPVVRGRRSAHPHPPLDGRHYYSTPFFQSPPVMAPPQAATPFPLALPPCMCRPPVAAHTEINRRLLYKMGEP